jgi:hypothetical protein
MRTTVQPIPGYQLRWTEVDNDIDEADDFREPPATPRWLGGPGVWLVLGTTAGWLLRYIVI